MKHYKKWTPKERRASYQKTKKAIREGVIPPPTKCNRCGQTEGIIHYHNHDYSDPIKYLEPLCWRCHLIFHSKRRNPEACEAYWKGIAEGKQWPPVFENDLGILRREHGIY